GGGRSLQQDAARDRPGEAAGADARLREIRARHRSTRDFPLVVVSDGTASRICEGLESQPKSLSQSGLGNGLAGQINTGRRAWNLDWPQRRRSSARRRWLDALQRARLQNTAAF